MNYRVELHEQAPDLKGYRLLLLDNQDQTIGYATGEFRQYAMWYDGQRHFFLHELVVADRTGELQVLSTELLKSVEAFARQEGAQWIRGQLALKATAYLNVPVDEYVLSAFWGKNGYSLKREIFDDSIRFWKPLYHVAN